MDVDISFAYPQYWEDLGIILCLLQLIPYSSLAPMNAHYIINDSQCYVYDTITKITAIHTFDWWGFPIFSTVLLIVVYARIIGVAIIIRQLWVSINFLISNILLNSVQGHFKR